ncbi:hypothetical protein [Robertmurraya kyonggiensis]|uniref:Uncharacterized protein n=1 Tax=Robertmurraya kyonggiensis TaxID=1037680 RepID=A0A4U1DAI2_9BACI|nr:hypothetical protein [Robertmurraya kyonggiensis]TKC19033.1 hypothetical protein FA727_05675 [Robertmurraya kyonggiensis]
MKRYWKILLLSIITLVVIGSFYIQASLAAKNTVQLKLEKRSGNEEELKGLSIHGDYGSGNLTQSFVHEADGETRILSGLSLIEEFTTSYTVPVIDKLIEEHRSFMRGKDLSPNYFFENESLVVYAGVKRDYKYNSIDFSFDIDVLDKKSNEVKSIPLDLSDTETYGWYDVIDVGVVDGQLKLITRSSLVIGGEEVNVYTFDIEKEKLLGTEKLISTITKDNSWTELSIISNSSSIEQEKYILFTTEILKDIEKDGNYVQEATGHEVQVYNIETNQLKKIDVRDELFNSIYWSTIVDSKLYISTPMEKGIEVIQYDIETDKWGEKSIIDLPKYKNGYESIYTTLMNGKIYASYLTDDGHELYIGDLRTGKSLYEGKIKVSNNPNKTEALYIHYIE